jgi:hypothetical protein
MSREGELERIRIEIKKAQDKYQRNREWQAFYAALSSLFNSLNNSSMRTVLPKIVAVDSIYRANLIRYLPGPEEDEDDTRPALYNKSAKAIIKLDLDRRFPALQEHSSRLNIHRLTEVVEIHKAVSQAVRNTIGEERHVFSSKYLHFCQPNFFPILDGNAEERSSNILDLRDPSDDLIIAKRFGYDEARNRYDRFCRAVLAIQAALAGAGLGQYSLAEMDRYLYGY